MLGAGARTHAERDIFEEAGPQVLEEESQLCLVRGLVEVEPSIVVVVSAVHSHASVCVALEVVGDAGYKANFFKLPSAIVLKR